MVCPYSPMNRISSAVLLLLAAAVCSPARAESWGEGIAGFYVTVDGGAQVRVTRASDGSYTGTIVWLRSDKNRLDKNNPDPGRKGDRVLGLVILREQIGRAHVCRPIGASDGSYTGTIVWLRSDKNRLDKNNPDPGRKGDRVLGLVILRELRANDETKRWEGGTIYDPKNGKTYDAFISPRAQGERRDEALGGRNDLRPQERQDLRCLHLARPG